MSFEKCLWSTNPINIESGHCVRRCEYQWNLFEKTASNQPKRKVGYRMRWFFIGIFLISLLCSNGIKVRKKEWKKRIGQIEHGIDIGVINLYFHAESTIFISMRPFYSFFMELFCNSYHLCVAYDCQRFPWMCTSVYIFALSLFSFHLHDWTIIWMSVFLCQM